MADQPRPFPLVTKFFVRPAGPPGRCFYCDNPVGEEHAVGCVGVVKRVRLAYRFEIEVDVPHHWRVSDIEFHRNEGSWCADNALDELRKLTNDQSEGCLCRYFSCEFLEVVDDEPRSSENG